LPRKKTHIEADVGTFSRRGKGILPGRNQSSSIKRIISIQLWDIGIFDKELSVKGRDIKVIAPLEKFDCERQNVELSENLRIRPVSDKERKSIWGTGSCKCSRPHG